MKKKIVFAILLTFLFCVGLFALGTLQGTVTDLGSGNPLVGAEINAISAGGDEYDAITDGTGYYIITEIVVETYDVSCYYQDYSPGLEEGVVIEDGVNTTVDFSLEYLAYYNNFEVNDGGLISSDLWDWGAFTSGPMAGHSGTNGWATSIGGNYPSFANVTLDTSMSYEIIALNAMFEFWHWYDIEAFGWDGGNVKISTDEGSSWSVIVPLTGYNGFANDDNPLYPEPIFMGHNQMFWELVQFDLSDYVGETVMFRWHFGSDSSVQCPGWYIDDVSLNVGDILEIGYIEGTVELVDGTGNVEDVLITAGTETTNPAANGDYSIEILEGTYDVVATLAGYVTDTVTGVAVEGGIITDGVDLTLTWITMPPINLAVDGDTALFTWEVPGGDGNLSDYSAFSVSAVGDFLKDLRIMGEETGELMQAKRFKVTRNTENARKHTPLVDFVTTEQSVHTRDLTGFEVYLNEELRGTTSNHEWPFNTAILTIGETYEAGLIAIYDEGESDYVSVNFVYGPVNAGNDLVIVTKLAGNYPNPFNPETNIAYSIEEAGEVSLAIYNMKGQLVRILVIEVKERGNYKVIWNGTDNSNKTVSSGIYFYKMKAGKFSETQKMILMK